MRLCIDLKTRISIAVLVLFLGGIGLLAYLTVNRLQQELTKLLADQQFAAVSNTAAEIGKTIRMRFDALSVVADDITPMMLARPARIDALLNDRPVLLSLFGNGLVVIGADGTALAEYPTTFARTGKSYVGIEYFDMVMASGGPAVGRPRIGRHSSRPGVAFAVPIRGDAGRIVGVLAGLANLNDGSLFGHMENSRVGRSGWLAVSDPRFGIIVAATDSKRNLQPLPKPGVNAMLDRFVTGHEGSGIAVNSMGIETLTSAKQIPLAGWFAQAVLPTEEAFAPIQAMKMRIYATAAALSVAATVLVWLLIRHLLRPLAQASVAIRAMADGEQELAELPFRQDDEVGELVHSFNLLAAQRRCLQDELTRQARTDFLTGLINRRHFIELAEQELARTTRYGGPLAVLMLDLDHFKQVNDSHGHKVGDQVLIRLAEVCRATLREIDITARLGGEEFAVLLPATDRTAAVEAAERLRVAVADTQVALEHGQPIRFTVSIGVTTRLGGDTSIDALLAEADRALYEAKHGGRNRVCVAPAADGVTTSEG